MEHGKGILLCGFNTVTYFVLAKKKKKTMLCMLNSSVLLKKPLGTIQDLDFTNIRNGTFLVHILIKAV